MAAVRPFDDAEFLQALGRVAISFVLLEGTLTACLNFSSRARPLKEIAELNYSRKVDDFISLMTADFEMFGKGVDKKQLLTLKAELKRVAAERNSLMHNFWTVEVATQQKVLLGMKGKGVPEKYPTPARLKKLSDKIYAVRIQLTGAMNQRLKLPRMIAPKQANV